MSEQKNRKQKIGSVRTEVFAMRLDPQLKFASELLARRQRRSLANLVEWTLDNTLRTTKIDESKKTAWEIGVELWDVSEPQRFINLATRYHDLLSYEEQCMLSIIKLMSVENLNEGPDISFYSHNKNKFIVWTIEACWPELKAYGFDSRNKNLEIMLRNKLASLYEK